MRLRTSKLTSAVATVFLASVWWTPANSPAQPLLNPVDTFHGVPFIPASSMVLSADGEYLYATRGADHLAVFRRQADGESFRWLAKTVIEVGEGVPLRAGNFLASPDEAHFYVADSDQGVLAVLERDPETGLLTQVQTLIAGERGLPIFERVASLAFSPLGDFLYLGQWASRELLAFERNPATGSLSLVQEISLDEGHGVPALAMSPGGEHLYALGRPLISILDRHPSSGRLSLMETLSQVTDENFPLISAIAGVVSPDGASLLLSAHGSPCYKCTEAALGVLRRDRLSGELELSDISEESVRLYPGAMAMSPDGRHVYFVDHGSSHDLISIFTLHADGGLESTGELAGQTEYGPSQTSSLVFDASGNELYASGFESRPFPRLDRDPTTGVLSIESLPTAPADAITRPSDLVASANSDHLYVAGSSGSAIASFTWDDASGALEPVDAVYLSELGIDPFFSPSRLRMNADGSRLYALGAGDSLVAFTRLTDGSLELLGPFDSQWLVGSLFDLAISPDGDNLYLLGRYGIATVSRDPLTDALMIVEVFDQARSFQSFTLSPDGKHLYTVADFDCPQQASCRALAILERDAASGLLTLRDTLFDLDSAILDRSYTAIVSPDSRHLYLSGQKWGVPLMASFARNPDDGSLRPVGSIVDGELGTQGHRTLAFAPDGRHLYSPRREENALVSFARDPASGQLRHLETLTEDALGTGSLIAPERVAVSHDNQLVFVASTESTTITTLSRRCLTSASACAGGDRFRIDVAWRDFEGSSGDASHLDPLGASSRIFWFFEQSNWEMLVKVLDGCQINDRWWVFAAAITDVETLLTVTDTWTAQRRTYSSSLGTSVPAITDAAAFATCDIEPISAASGAPTSASEPAPAKAGCNGGPGLCISDRFDIRVQWRDTAGQTGFGNLAPIDSESSGILWFFDDTNWEMLVKVLDGCDINDRVWVFAAQTTDVETTLTVTDRVTGAQQIYHKPLGVAAPAVTDTNAFASCSGS